MRRRLCSTAATTFSRVRHEDCPCRAALEERRPGTPMGDVAADDGVVGKASRCGLPTLRSTYHVFPWTPRPPGNALR
jgi:hypothetical protein